MIRKATWRWIVVTLCVATCPGPALAQREPAPDEDAHALFERGRRAYIGHHFLDAAHLFERAFALSGRPLMLLNVGNAWIRLEQRERAATALRQYLRLAPEAQDRALVEARIALLEAPGDDLLAGGQGDDAGGAPSAGLIAGRTWTWVAAGASLLLGAVALGTWMKARAVYDDLAGTCGRASGCTEGQLDEVSTWITAARVGAGLSAASLVGGVLLWFIEGQPPGNEGVVAGAAPAFGLRLTGSF